MGTVSNHDISSKTRHNKVMIILMSLEHKYFGSLPEMTVTVVLGRTVWIYKLICFLTQVTS